LVAQFQPLKNKIKQAIEDCLDSMHLFLGPNMQTFEDEFGTYCGGTELCGRRQWDRCAASGVAGGWGWSGRRSDHCRQHVFATTESYL
jgi:hypothetical protein